MTSDTSIRKMYSVSVVQTILFFGFVSLLFILAILLDNRLPTPLKNRDEVDYPHSFITERAQNDLLELAGDGPRVVGSAQNEVDTVNLLVRKLRNITKYIPSRHKLEVDVQTVSGSYYLDYKPFGGYNIYSNVQNVIVKLYSSTPSKHSVLLNAHFDSVPTSPGGSDDGIMCAVMLETIRKVLKWNETLQYNIIFLFNGAEESPLQAAHGFITKHKWAKDIRVVINLEAAGSGGKAILFQSGPDYSWLLKYYSKVPHPYGQVAGEEIFQSNLIPSDTDFRLFRDFGNVVGFDIAFFKNGYRYHTNYDNVQSIPLGSYQHIGDNVLALVKGLANAPEISNMNSSRDKAVYFDFMGLFMIWYKEYIGIIINSVVVLFSFITAYKSFRDFKLGHSRKSKIYLIITAFVIPLGWGLAAIGVLSIAFFIDILNCSMRWYASPYLMFGLYVIPTVLFSAIPLICWNNLNEKLHFSVRVQCQLQYSVIRLIWTVVLLIMTCLSIRAAYALMIPVLFNTVGSIFIHLTKLHHSENAWKIIYLIFNAFPSLMIIYQTLTVLSLFVPITGRIGSDRNPEIIIGILVMLLTIIFSSFYIHFITLMKRPLWLLYFFLAIFLINLIVIFCHFPYSGDPNAPAQQRFMVYHTKRKFNNAEGLIKQDSGYFLVNLDRNSPRSVKPYVRRLEKTVSVKDDCKNFLVCGLPLITPRMMIVMESSTWVPAEQPVLSQTISLQLTSKSFKTPKIISYGFIATGPDHLNIYLSPKENIYLVNTSFADTIPSNSPLWNGRPVYFVNYVWGVSKAPLKFFLDFEVPKNWDRACVDIAISGKYVHDAKNKYTAQFKDFISEFPKWANVVPAIANFESWEM